MATIRTSFMRLLLLGLTFSSLVTAQPPVRGGGVVSGNPGDLFGDALAVSGDTLVVGAPATFADGVPISGAVHVYQRDGRSGEWMAVTVLQEAMPGVGNYFGISVAIDGDLIAIGANMRFNGNGKVILFSRSADGTWSWWQDLVASDGARFDQYGYALALRDDTLAIGAYSAGGRGKVYVYPISGDGRANERALQTLEPQDSRDSDNGRFGWSVALEGNAVFCGAPRDSANGRNAGAVYAFEKDVFGVYRRTDWKRGDAGTFFGHALDADGGFVAVSRFSSTFVSTQVYSYEAGGGPLVLEETDDKEYRGILIDMDVALNNGMLLFGAAQTLALGREGVTYVIELERDAWVETAELIPSQDDKGDQFGYRVALSDDYIAIGSADATSREGAVYMYERPKAPTVSPTPAPSDVPSAVPSMPPSDVPSTVPSGFPSQLPTIEATPPPTTQPSLRPSLRPTPFPSLIPSSAPTSDETPGFCGALTRWLPVCQ